MSHDDTLDDVDRQLVRDDGTDLAWMLRDADLAAVDAHVSEIRRSTSVQLVRELHTRYSAF